MSRFNKKFSADEFLKVIQDSVCHADALNKLGYRNNTGIPKGTRYHKLLLELNPDCSHFTHQKKEINEEQVIKLYNGGESSLKIAELFDTYPIKIRRILYRHNIEIRDVQACQDLRVGPKNSMWTGYGEISGANWAGIKNAADKRNISFNLKIEDAWNLFIKQERKCAYTGLELTFPERDKDRRYGRRDASLDRIDSNIGYSIENVQWIHKDINAMKMSLSENEFLELIRLIYNHRRLK